MKVSIITVCYNSEATIGDTLQSVDEQTYSDIEYIVIDGGSSDGTNYIVRQNERLVDQHVIETDEGIYDAMNKGLRIATGDIIGILNSDDFFASPNTVAEIVKKFESAPELDAVYGDVVYVMSDNLNSASRFYSGRIFKKALIRFGFMLPHPTFYVRKNAVNQLGHYKTNYRVAADFEFITRFFVRGLKAEYINSVFVKMREGGISSSGLLWRVHQNFEIVRACRENGLYTNIFIVSLKLPYKLWTLLKAKFGWVKVAV